MARKGPQQERRPEQAAPDRQAERRQHDPDSTQAALQDAAMPTRGASAGIEPPRQTGVRDAEPRRDGDSTAGVVDFAQQLAEMAGPEFSEEGSLALEGGDQQEAELDIGPQATGAPPEMAGKLGAGLGAGGAQRRAKPKEFGDEESPNSDDGDAGPATRSKSDAPSSAPRIRPQKRAEHVELQALLDHALELAILSEYHCTCVPDALLHLSWQEFEELQAALDACQTDVQRIIVLGALAAHRPTSQLDKLASELIDQEQEALLQRFSSQAGATRPGKQTTIEELRLWYDPIVALAGPQSSQEEGAEVATWSIPKWLRGIPTEPLEMAAVAIDQFLRGELHPAGEQAQEAGDLLTRALEHHGQQHPSLQRWLLSVCARADSRGNLLAARDTVLLARNQLVALN